MGIIQRQSISSSLLNYIGVFLGFVNMVWLFPNILGPDYFGLIRVLMASSLIISQFGELGIPSVIVRYFPYFKDDNFKHHGFFSWVLLIITFGALLTILILVIFNNQIIGLFDQVSESLFSEYYIYLLVITFFTIYSEVLFAYSRANLRSVEPVVIKELGLRLMQLFTIGLFFFDLFTIGTFVILFSMIYVIQFLITFFTLYKRGFLYFGRPMNIGKIVPKVELYRYAIYMLLNRLPNVALNQIDIIMLGILAGFSDAGKYSIAFYLANILKIPARNISQISQPLLARSFKNRDLDHIAQLYKQTSINQLIVGSFFLIVVITGFEDLTFFLDKSYHGIFTVTLWVGLAKVFDIATGINGGIIVNSKYYKWSLYFNTILLITAIIFNLLFIPQFGIVGAAFATALSVFLLNSVKYIFVFYKFKMQPFSFKTLIAVIIAVISFAVGYFIDFGFYPVLNFVVRALLVLIIYGALVYFLNVSKEINNLLNSILSRISRLINWN